ncbi:MAG: leucyl/phenylalanyl-tRNA--protein transferase [Robiginitomaculum sp.]|nr:leucyl/phenylalanyl-tRNA--protein transferase [Robiginitomaculum sp.]
MSGFGPLDLLNLYATGVFPMAEARDSDDVFIVDPEERGVIPLDGLKINKSLAKTVRAGVFEIRVNTAFSGVVSACAASAPGREDTWINPGIEYLYAELHQLGRAHSVECWQGGELVGGLYGVHLGAAFFGESMFSRKTDASKVALVHLVGRLNTGGFKLLDTQFITPHLLSLGAVEISRNNYQARLRKALELVGEFEPFGFLDVDYSKSVRPSSAVSGAGRAKQSITHIS